MTWIRLTKIHMAIAATGNTFKNQNTNFAYMYETTNKEESLCRLQKHKHRGNQLLLTRQSTTYKTSTYWRQTSSYNTKSPSNMKW